MRAYSPIPAMLLAAAAIVAACTPDHAPTSYAVEVITCTDNGRDCDANRPAVYLSLEDCMRAAPAYHAGADSVACVNLSYGVQS